MTYCVLRHTGMTMHSPFLHTCIIMHTLNVNLSHYEQHHRYLSFK